VHRIITYVPTYSGMDYPEFHVIQIILVALMFLFCLNTMIAEKTNILIDRIMAYWEGRAAGASKKRKGGAASSGGASYQQQQMGGSTAGTTPLSPTAMTGTPVQTLPDYNNFYTKDTTPLVGAATPGSEGFAPMMPAELGPALAQGGAGMGVYEPMAANAVLGGGSFGSAHW
jgi:hypothetical protein